MVLPSRNQLIINDGCVLELYLLGDYALFARDHHKWWNVMPEGLY